MKTLHLHSKGIRSITNGTFEELSSLQYLYSSLVVLDLTKIMLPCYHASWPSFRPLDGQLEQHQYEKDCGMVLQGCSFWCQSTAEGTMYSDESISQDSMVWCKNGGECYLSSNQSCQADDNLLFNVSDFHLCWKDDGCMMRRFTWVHNTASSGCVPKKMNGISLVDGKRVILKPVTKDESFGHCNIRDSYVIQSMVSAIFALLGICWTILLQGSAGKPFSLILLLGLGLGMVVSTLMKNEECAAIRYIVPWNLGLEIVHMLLHCAVYCAKLADDATDDDKDSEGCTIPWQCNVCFNIISVLFGRGMFSSSCQSSLVCWFSIQQSTLITMVLIFIYVKKQCESPPEAGCPRTQACMSLAFFVLVLSVQI